MADIVDFPSDPPERAAPSRECECHLAHLLAQAAAGDRDAFALVYDATVERSFGLAAHLLGDRAEAEEVTLSAYLHLWAHAGEYDAAKGSATSWILALVHQRAVTLVHAGRPRLVPPDGDMTGRPRGGSLVSASPDVLGAWAALSSPLREAVELTYFQGRSCSEVASSKGVPLSAVRSAICDGLHALGQATGRHA